MLSLLCFFCNTMEVERLRWHIRNTLDIQIH